MRRAKIRKILRWFLRLLVSGFLAIVVAMAIIIAFPEQVIRYLYVNKPQEPDILVVEGWVSDPALEAAAGLFQQENYRHMVTTGGPLEPFVTLYVNGFLDFSFAGGDSMEEIAATYVPWVWPGDTLLVTLSGSPAKGEWPHFRVLINGVEAGEGTVQREWEEYPVVVAQGEDPFRISSIRVVFDNDDTALGEDRNLSVQSVTIAGNLFPSRSPLARVYSGSQAAPVFEYGAGVLTHAEECRARMIQAGIDGDSITAVPAPPTETNRTYTSALSVAAWIDSGGYSAHFYNIFSEGIHARRTWFLYRFALRERSGAVGILSSSNIEHLSQNPSLLRGMIFRELAGNLYYRLVFNKRKLKKEMLGGSPGR